VSQRELAPVIDPLAVAVRTSMCDGLRHSCRDAAIGASAR
jgi:hypothetical protein